jgi:hypothetical protein
VRVRVRLRYWLLLATLGLSLSGCLSPRPDTPRTPRRFDFTADTVGFANETLWIYEFDAAGRMSHRRRDPPPSYSLRCFVVARLNRQFFDHARFVPEQPRPGPAELAERVSAVVHRSPRTPSPDGDRIVLPGYANLRELSLDQEPLLKRLGGHGWESYVQRGHWRSVFPFTRRHQLRTTEQLLTRLADGRPLVLHLVRFPQLTINHAVLAFDARRTADGCEFLVADPNEPNQPRTLEFDRATGHFQFGPNPYFGGGRVDVYEVFHGPWY